MNRPDEDADTHRALLGLFGGTTQQVLRDPSGGGFTVSALSVLFSGHLTDINDTVV